MGAVQEFLLYGRKRFKDHGVKLKVDATERHLPKPWHHPIVSSIQAKRPRKRIRGGATKASAEYGHVRPVEHNTGLHVYMYNM